MFSRPPAGQAAASSRPAAAAARTHRGCLAGPDSVLYSESGGCGEPLPQSVARRPGSADDRWAALVAVTVPVWPSVDRGPSLSRVH